MLKRITAAVAALAIVGVFNSGPAMAAARNHQFPDSCSVYISNGGGSYPWGQTAENHSCYQMRASIYYQRASNGTWYHEWSPWSVSTVSRTASYPASTYNYSRHSGDSTLGDCCYYTTTLYR